MRSAQRISVVAAVAASSLVLALSSAPVAHAATYYQLVARHSGKCVTVPNGNMGHDVPVEQWTCRGEADQQFGVDHLDHGEYAIKARHSGKCLDVEWASHDSRARIVQANCHYGDNQRWYQQPTSDGYVLLIAKHSGKCMDVAWADQGDGAPLVQSGCWHGNNQQFKLALV
ncbi:RICIN domain-containing protein [Streptomyces sirii]|uniref:RICIN domain-containing protein n=1 Tax=Streptomyces sirii TaxID=3127701 RepID=UPI003D368019